MMLFDFLSFNYSIHNIVILTLRHLNVAMFNSSLMTLMFVLITVIIQLIGWLLSTQEKEVKEIVDSTGRTVTVTIIPTFIFEHIMKRLPS